MAWRSKRSGHKAEQVLAGATVARVTGAEGSRAAGVDALRQALARAELERRIESIVIVALDDAPLADELGADLGADRNVTVLRGESVRIEEVDAAFAVASASMPAQTVVAALERLDSILLGVVLAGEADSAAPPELADEPVIQPVEREPVESGDAAFEALAELERAAAGSPSPSPSPPPVPVPARAPAPSPPAADRAAPVDDELARRLTELTHREVALRRVTEVVEQQRTKLEKRLQELESSEAAQAAAAPPAVDDAALQALVERAKRAEERAEQAVERAEQAEQAATDATQRADQAEQKAGELSKRLAELEGVVELQRDAIAVRPDAVRPVEYEEELVPLMPDAGASADAARYSLQRIDQLIRDAQLAGDPRAEEWTYYLPLLREHADTAGRLPPGFYSLVDSVFGDE